MASTFPPPAQTTIAATRNKLAAVTERSPMGLDINGYSPGHFWRAPNSATVPWFQAQRTTAGSLAVWQSYGSTLGAAASAVAGAAKITGMCALVAGYTGSLFDVTRASDLTAQTFAVYQSGLPNCAAIDAFLNDGVGYGYITKRYDQTGNGNHDIQATLASAPRIDTTHILNGAPACLYDYDRRIYVTNGRALLVASSGTNTLTLYALDPAVAPGVGATGTNIPSNTNVTAINYATNTVTLSNATTGSVTNVTFVQPKVWLETASLTTTLNSHAIFTVACPPNLKTYFQPATLGVSGSAAFSGSATYAMLQIGGGSNLAFGRCVAAVSGTNAGYSLALAPAAFQPHSEPSVYGYSRSGRVISYQFEEVAGTYTANSDPGAATLSGGSLGFSNQFQAPGVVFGGDLEEYATIIFGAGITQPQCTLLYLALNDTFGLKPQKRNTILFDGSSLTRGTGGYIAQSWPREFCAKVIDYFPSRALNFGIGQSVESCVQAFNTVQGPGSYYDKNNAKTLIWQPPIGNSIQANLSLTITGQSGGNVLTTSTDITPPSFCSVGAAITATTGIAAGTTVLSVSGGNITLSQPYTGTVTGAAIVNSSQAQIWNSITSYIALARAAGFVRTANGGGLEIWGQFARGTFSAPQLAVHDALKAQMAAQLPGLCDAYVDSESDPYFAGDTPWITTPAAFNFDLQHPTTYGYPAVTAVTFAAASGTLIL